MNREIKFRVWDTTFKKMFSWLNYVNGDICLSMIHVLNDKTGQYIGMQYTGLKDKNEKEIYEGDIVQRDCPNPGCPEKHLLEIRWEFINGGTGFFAKNWEEKCYNPIFMGNVETGIHAPITIIGNIYENPELLPKGKPTI